MALSVNKHQTMNKHVLYNKFVSRNTIAHVSYWNIVKKSLKPYSSFTSNVYVKCMLNVILIWKSPCVRIFSNFFFKYKIHLFFKKSFKIIRMSRSFDCSSLLNENIVPVCVDHLTPSKCDLYMVKCARLKSFNNLYVYLFIKKKRNEN